jgi:hypothetical protein
MKVKMVFGFGYPRACRFRKYLFENRSWELRLPTFSKRDLNLYNVAKIGKN